MPVKPKPKAKKKKVVTTKVIRPKGPSTAMKTKKGGVDHEHRWGLIVELGKSKAANILGISPNALNPTIKKYKDWNPELPFAEEPAQIVEEKPIIVPEGPIEIITRITQPEYDSRFYHSNIRVNSRTGKNYFPSFSFLSSLGSPSSPTLDKWRMDHGHHAEIIFEERRKSGTILHDLIDRIIKQGIPVTEDEIDEKYPRYAQEIKNGLLGFVNFWEAYKPKVYRTEHTILSDDEGGTEDFEGWLNVDNYEKLWTLDWKSSKVVNDKHKLQACVYQKMAGTQACGIVIFGNQTQKKFTFTEVKEKEREQMLKEWACIKELAYLKLIDDKFTEPKPHPYPTEFKITRHE